MLQAVFLDLDGTLIDPKEGITLSLQYALDQMQSDVPSQNELTWCIGPPLWDSLRVLLGEKADIETALGHYRERYLAQGMYEADVYDGIGEMLIDLSDSGAQLWVATSKPHVYANEIISHFGISSYVDGLFGAELDGTNSDKTDLLMHALNETGVDPGAAVMIGDRKFDIIGAQNNDIRAVGAMWGYAEDGELHMAEADALTGAPEETAEIAFELMGVDKH